MRIFFIVILMFMISGLKSQSFEGYLIYNVDFEIPETLSEKGLTKKILKSKLESEGTWTDSIQIFYKNGFYKQLNYSRNPSWTIYNPDSTKLYSFTDGSDLCTVVDASKDFEYEVTSKKPEILLIDTLISYAEYKLNMLQVVWNSGVYTYYYDKNYFPVNPEFYRGHNYDGFYEFLKLSGSYPVIIKKEVHGVVIVVMSLAQHKATIIDQNVFKIPELIYNEDLNSWSFGNKVIYKIKN